MAEITLNNPMGGITYPFLDSYVWTDSYGTEWAIAYTPNMAGGSGPGTGLEGWVCHPEVGWQPGEPEIFCYYGMWYSFEPQAYDYPNFDSFLNGVDGTGGLRYYGGFGAGIEQVFMPPQTGDVSGSVAAQGSLSGLLRRAPLRLSGSIAAEAASAPALGRLRPVSGAVAAQAGGLGVLLVGDFLSGVAATHASLTARPVATRRVPGRIVAQSDHSARLSRLCALRAACAAAGVAVGPVGCVREFTGEALGLAALTGILLDVNVLCGTVAAGGSLAGHLLRVRPAVGEAAAVAFMEGHAIRVRSVAGLAAAETALAQPVLVRFWIPSVEIPQTPPPGMRRLTWGTKETVQIWIDGEYRAHAEGGEFVLPADTVIRQFLDVWDEPPHTIRTPLDRVSLSWTGDAPRYEVWRRKNGGSWQKVAETVNTEYVDGPLPDGAYDYKVVAVDEEGDTAESDPQSLLISSAPEPPSKLTVQ